MQVNRLNGSRLERDTGYAMPSFKDRIRDQINTARRERRLPELGAA
jgi:hypothetical protein